MFQQSNLSWDDLRGQSQADRAHRHDNVVPGVPKFRASHMLTLQLQEYAAEAWEEHPALPVLYRRYDPASSDRYGLLRATHFLTVEVYPTCGAMLPPRQ